MHSLGSTDFMGMGMIWGIGVIEDINDPMKLGRVRVRVHGWHTDDKQDIPTKSLPWALVMQPTTSAATSGIGINPNMVNGTWCVLFFRDGTTGQDPIIMGTLAGKPNTNADISKGFNDPEGMYPNTVGESDINRLARNENIEQTIVQTKRDNLDINIPIANSDNTFSELTTKYNTVYPNNNVKETKSGHIVEYDDSTGAERIHHYHKSGTFEEIFPDGSLVKKIIKDKYEIIYGDENIYVKGNVNIKIDGNASLYVVGNVEEQITGNINQVVTGNINRIIGGNLTETVTGNITRIVSGSITRIATGVISDKGSQIHHN